MAPFDGSMALPEDQTMVARKTSEAPPPSPLDNESLAGLAIELSGMLGSWASELLESNPTADRHAELRTAINGVVSGAFEWSADRFKRMAIVRVVDLAVILKCEGAVAVAAIQQARWALTKDPSEGAILAAVAAWARDGAVRDSNKDPLAWDAMAALIKEAGLGVVKPSTLKVDWSKWKRITRDG